MIIYFITEKGSPSTQKIAVIPAKVRITAIFYKIPAALMSIPKGIKTEKYVV